MISLFPNSNCHHLFLLVGADNLLPQSMRHFQFQSVLILNISEMQFFYTISPLQLFYLRGKLERSISRRMVVNIGLAMWCLDSRPLSPHPYHHFGSFSVKMDFISQPFCKTMKPCYSTKRFYLRRMFVTKKDSGNVVGSREGIEGLPKMAEL